MLRTVCLFREMYSSIPKYRDRKTVVNSNDSITCLPVARIDYSVVWYWMESQKRRTLRNAWILFNYLLTYLLIRRYNRFAVLACLKSVRNRSQSPAFFCQSVIPALMVDASTPSCHLNLGLPRLLCPCGQPKKTLLGWVVRFRPG